MVTSRWGKGAGSPECFRRRDVCPRGTRRMRWRGPGIASETMPRPALVHRVALSAGATEHRLVGRVQALQSVPLAFEVSGVLASLAPREGDYFVAGERLAQLDPSPLCLRGVGPRSSSNSLLFGWSGQRRCGTGEPCRCRSGRGSGLAGFEGGRLRRGPKGAGRYVPLRPFRRSARQTSSGACDACPDGRCGAHRSRPFSGEDHRSAGSSPSSRIGGWGRFLAEAIFPGAPEQAFPLRLLDNRAEADAGAQSYEVAFALDQPADLPLVPGMQMTVRLRRSERQPPGDSRFPWRRWRPLRRGVAGFTSGA